MIVLKGGTLIDGTGRAPARRDHRGATTDGSSASRPVPTSTGPAGAEVIDVSGRTVLPGLIDCHDHLASHGYDLATRWELDEPSSTRHLRTGRALERTLDFGYTTIRDAGGLDAGLPRRGGRGPGPRAAAARPPWRSCRPSAGSATA